MHSLEHLYLEELRDLYDAEKQITKALPKMMEAASSPELQRAFQMHLEQTKKQIQRLEKVFEAMGEDPAGEHCEGIEGLLKEGEELLGKRKEADPAVFDAALIVAAQKVEHYEIAAYGSVCTFAEMLGKREDKELLGSTLEEEEATDEKLTRLAESLINPEAAEGGSSGARGSR
ncbi:hypothetical protein Mterra_03814 [Calidithermus terrae]|uniref:Uncharacterized protein n=1 Tax=Calidithermus terrae TaxID=1408545 RepID=A0A399E014_9DEIN|nr:MULTISPECIES: ferritin-like domain-containing protein [Calidithermus]RIH77008.1 hypothetical protein Mterra_03814 [Calidithermus terrae]